MTKNNNSLYLKQLGIDTYKEAVIFMRLDCSVCRSEGFEVQTRVRVSINNNKNNNTILATLYSVSDGLLKHNEVSLSTYAWQLLDAKEGDEVILSHPKPLQSLSYVRSKVYGESLDHNKINNIINDISKGLYSDIHIATFLTACAGGRLSYNEIIDLTKAMIAIGESLTWPYDIIVDKHCVGGLPGNRTTLIVVPIVTAFGLMMPKTSSRAITSPAGTADTMEIFAPVNLDTNAMKKIVEKEGGCIVWGGSVDLSPADDILIRVERVMDLDSEGQLIASVISKKISAGSNKILIDIPVGHTAKVRNLQTAQSLSRLFKNVAKALNIKIETLITDGSQPVGRGIGPALEAQDVLQVLKNDPNAPRDLKERALIIAGKIIEFDPSIKPGAGKQIANKILTHGLAYKKFEAICRAQGGFQEPPVAEYTHPVLAPYRGRVTSIDNRQIARLAKLAGAPHCKAAGVLLYTPLETLVEKNEPLFVIHAQTKGELNYALSLLDQIPEIIQVEACE